MIPDNYSLGFRVLWEQGEKKMVVFLVKTAFGLFSKHVAMLMALHLAGTNSPLS